jgi:thioredoxin 1
MTVLYFTMKTCGPCKAFKPVLQQVSSQLGVSINYIDVDHQGSLAQQYNVNSVPTLIIVNPITGEIKHRSSGAMSAAQLTNVLTRSK